MAIISITNTWQRLVVVHEQGWTEVIQKDFTKIWCSLQFDYLWKSALESDAILFNTSVHQSGITVWPPASSCVVQVATAALTPNFNTLLKVSCGICLVHCEEGLPWLRLDCPAHPTDARLDWDLDDMDAILTPLPCFVFFKHSWTLWTRPQSLFLIQNPFDRWLQVELQLHRCLDPVFSPSHMTLIKFNQMKKKLYLYTTFFNVLYSINAQRQE